MNDIPTRCGECAYWTGDVYQNAAPCELTEPAKVMGRFSPPCSGFSRTVESLDAERERLLGLRSQRELPGLQSQREVGRGQAMEADGAFEQARREGMSSAAIAAMVVLVAVAAAVAGLLVWAGWLWSGR